MLQNKKRGQGALTRLREKFLELGFELKHGKPKPNKPKAQRVIFRWTWQAVR